VWPDVDGVKVADTDIVGSGVADAQPEALDERNGE